MTMNWHWHIYSHRLHASLISGCKIRGRRCLGRGRATSSRRGIATSRMDWGQIATQIGWCKPSSSRISSKLPLILKLKCVFNWWCWGITSWYYSWMTRFCVRLYNKRRMQRERRWWICIDKRIPTEESDAELPDLDGWSCSTSSNASH